MLTDPVLRNRVAHLVRPAGGWEENYLSPDIVLLSHAHLDHFDRPSLAMLSRDARLVVPRGLGRAVKRLGFSEVVEVQEGDDVNLGIRIHVTHAEHGAKAVGYLVGGVYFAGDTDIFPGMESIRSEVALLPVSGWGSRVPAGHLDPPRAAKALALLRPRVAIPIHWGGFRPFYMRSPRFADAGREFAELAATTAPGVEVRVLHPGETFFIPTG